MCNTILYRGTNIVYKYIQAFFFYTQYNIIIHFYSILTTLRRV